MSSDQTLALRFGWVSLFQDLGSKMVVPILPLYLAVGLGASPLAIGLIDGVAAVTTAVVAPAAGRLAARRAPLPLVRTGYAVSSLAKLALAATVAWPAVLAVRVVDRAGKGLRDAPRDLLLTRGAVARQGRTFGIQQAMDKFGGFLGPLAGLGVYQLSGQRFDPVFVVAFVPCALSVALLWAIPTTANVDADDAQDDERSETPQRAADEAMTRRQRWALAVLALHGVAFVPVSLLLLRAAEVGLSVASILLAYAVLRLMTALASYPFGALVDRLGAGAVLVVGMSITAAALALAATADDAPVMWTSLALVGVADAAARGPAKVWLVGLGPTGARGPALGARSAATSAAALVSGLAVGALWAGDGTTVLAVAALLAVAAAGAAVAVDRLDETVSQVGAQR